MRMSFAVTVYVKASGPLSVNVVVLTDKEDEVLALSLKASSADLEELPVMLMMSPSSAFRLARASARFISLSRG